MLTRKATLAVAGLVAFAAPAAAQDPSVPIELSFGFGGGRNISTDCTVDEPEFTVTFSNCPPFSWSVGGEFAVHATEWFAPFLGASWGTFGWETVGHFHDQWESVDIPMRFDGTSVSVRGGTRFYFQPRASRARAFASVAAGFYRGRFTAAALDFPTIKDSAAHVGFGWSPGGGVEVAITPSLLIRFAANVDAGFGDDRAAVSGSTAFVFRFD